MGGSKSSGFVRCPEVHAWLAALSFVECAVQLHVDALIRSALADPKDNAELARPLTIVLRRNDSVIRGSLRLSWLEEGDASHYFAG